MPAHVTVYPTKASALNIKHPHGHKMTLAGVIWPKDGFTGRRLRDGSVTMNEVKAYKPAAVEASVAPTAVAPVTPTAAPASSTKTSVAD